MYCTECGSRIDGRFCANCGTRVQGAEGKQVSKATRLIVIGAIVLVALIVGIVLLAGHSSPERTVRNFLFALEKGDLARFVSTIDQHYLNELGEYRGFWEQQMQYMLDETSSAWMENKIQVRIVHSTVVGDEAEVNVQFRSLDDTENETFFLIKQGNKWYIDYNRTSGLGY